MKESLSPDSRPTVLVVDDEEQITDLYTDFLADTYTIRSANSGNAALAALDESVDVVLLDRRMPGMSGDEVLEEIEARDVDCRIVLVTGVSPEMDIIELPIDDYLVKPVTSVMLHDAVERMLVRNTYDDRIRRIVALASKMSTLEAKLSIEEMQESGEYAELQVEYIDLLHGSNGSDPNEDLYTEFSIEKLQTLFSDAVISQS